MCTRANVYACAHVVRQPVCVCVVPWYLPGLRVQIERERRTRPSRMAVVPARRAPCCACGTVRGHQAHALARGPIALNWYDIQRAIHRDNDGDHIVLHEFSHQLDMIDDPKADGVPPLPRGMNADRWKKDFEMEFQWARDMVEQGEAIVVDDYGLTHPSEFFAVATECYFQIPWDLREYQPNLYRMLQEFYVTDLADAMDTP